MSKSIKSASKNEKSANKGAVKNVVKSAVSNAKTQVIAEQNTGGADALNGRLESRTHYMHVVLIDAYKRAELLSTKEIVARTRKLMGADHKSYEKLDRTAPSHINTMKTRLYIERFNGAWRLTALGASDASLALSKQFEHTQKQVAALTKAKAPAPVESK